MILDEVTQFKKKNIKTRGTNFCPFMAMELTKLKYLNDKEKKKGKSLPSCSPLHPTA
jgi:hypothetical protein